jgi:deoxyribodipyrimidine photolyase
MPDAPSTDAARPVILWLRQDLRLILRRGDPAFVAPALAEPWTVKTGAGGPYQTFTPFWRAAQATLGPAAIRPAPAHIPAPARWPDSDDLRCWRPARARRLRRDADRLTPNGRDSVRLWD